MTNSASGPSTPTTSPMYSNGRLTAAHRDRLQRILTKQEMGSSTTKQAFRAPQRGYTPPSRLQRQTSTGRIQTPLTQVSRVCSSQSQMRPATAASTTRRSKPPTAHKAPNPPGSKSFRTRTRTGDGGGRLTRIRSRAELTQKRTNSKTWKTEGLLLGQVQQEMKQHMSSTGKSSTKGSARSVMTQSTAREETPMTEPERNAHTSCFMRARENKYLASGTPPIDDEEVSSLLDRMRLKEARSKLPDRSPTATLLYGFREEITLSPEATPRPTRLMEERDAAKDVGDVNWISIVEHNQRLATHDDLRNEKMEKAVRQEFCKRLAQQRVEGQDALRKEVEEREREKLRLSSMYQQWHKEDAGKVEQQRKRVQQLKMGFHQQLSAIEQKRRHETDKWKRRERRQVDALKASLADERAKNEQKKAENRKKIMQMTTENNKKIELRRAEAMCEAAEEIRLQKAYAAQLERHETQRREAKAKIEERQTKNMANLLAATKKSFKQQAEEDEQRAEREHREAHERMERIDREKRERHERNQRHTNAVILRQREEKEAVQLQDRAEWRLYGDYLNKDAELYEEEQRYHVEAQHQKNLKQTELLREQVKLNEQRRLAERADMSENERLYNHSLLSDCEKSLRTQASHSQDEGLTTERMATQVDKRSPFRWRTKNRPRPF